MSNELKLASPWMIFAREIKALFGDDPAIEVTYDDTENPTVKLYVQGQSKAEAISELLPNTKTFGNVTLYIDVIPANEQRTRGDIYRVAFEGNPALDDVVSAYDLAGALHEFVVFDDVVVQYINDDFRDLNGVCSTLYQEIAKDVFDGDVDVSFCTVVNKDIKPF